MNFTCLLCRHDWVAEPPIVGLFELIVAGEIMSRHPRVRISKKHCRRCGTERATTEFLDSEERADG